MSVIYQCDVCGKDSGMSGIMFSALPLFMNVKSHDNKDFRISLNVLVENEEDYQNFMQAMEMVVMAKGTVSINDAQQVNSVLKKNTYSPMICNHCKRHLAKTVLQDGKFEEENIKSYSDYRSGWAGGDTMAYLEEQLSGEYDDLDDLDDPLDETNRRPNDL